jgi:hypothetical protein
MKEMILKLIEFSHSHHPSVVKVVAKYTRRGISVGDTAFFKAAPKILLKGGVIGSAITASFVGLSYLGYKGYHFLKDRKQKLKTSLP